MSKGIPFSGEKDGYVASCKMHIRVEQELISTSWLNRFPFLITYSRIDKQRPFPLSKKNDVSSPFILPPFLFRMHSIPETRIEVDAPHDIGD